MADKTEILHRNFMCGIVKPKYSLYGTGSLYLVSGGSPAHAQPEGVLLKRLDLQIDPNCLVQFAKWLVYLLFIRVAQVAVHIAFIILQINLHIVMLSQHNLQIDL